MRGRAVNRFLSGFVLALAVLTVPPAGAPAMTCGQATGLVGRAGAIVLGTGGYTYDRFVAHRGFCEITQVTKRAFVPTRDNPACLVGYRCIEPGRDDFFDQF